MKAKVLCTIGILILIYFPLFGWMDWMPIRMFDEGRNAVNAVEMLWSENYLVTTYGGVPDFFNTKPPFMFWLQVCSMKIFGINEISVRMPIALTALATCLLIFWFSRKYLQNQTIGIFSVLILMTSMGYVNYHGSRSGDFDVLLTFFLTLNAMSFFLYLEYKTRQFLILFFISLILAVYSKSIVGFMFVPSYLLYIILTRNYFVFRRLEIYLGSILSIIVIGTFFILREHYNPGYLNAVNNIDILGRYNSVIDGHDHPWYFYIQHLCSSKFVPWIYLLFIGIFMYRELNGQLIGKFFKFSVLIMSSFILIISVSQSKLFWYDMPVYPLASIIAAGGVYTLYIRIKKINLKRAGLFIFLLFGIPYSIMFSHIYVPRVNDAEKATYYFAYYVMDHFEKLRNFSNLNIVWKNYSSVNVFYSYMLKSKMHGISINKTIEKGDYVLLIQDELRQLLETNYKFHKELDENGIVVYQIL